MYEVVLSAEAQKIYASADQALAKKIARCFEQLEQSPRSSQLVSTISKNPGSTAVAQ
jgi:hypothetical protein